MGITFVIRLKVFLSLFFICCSNACYSQPIECGNPDFEHKSETEIKAMSPEEKMDEMVLEQMFHAPWDNDESYKNLHLALIEDAENIIPRAIEFLDEYDPEILVCKDRNNARLLTAAIYLDTIDSAKIRIRGIEDGRTAIKALEHAIERRQRIISEKDFDGRQNLLNSLLKGIKGRTIKDGLIQKTLNERYKLKISEEELDRFIEFLIDLDPSYPAWTHVLGWAEMTPEEVKKYHQTYLTFRGPERSK